MFSKVGLRVSPFFNYSKAYHPPKGSVQHFFIVRFIIIPKASPLPHLFGKFSVATNHPTKLSGENWPTDWPKVLCFGGSSKPTAFSTSSRTFDVDRGAFGGIPSDGNVDVFLFFLVFLFEKNRVKVRMFGVVFSRYTQIDTDYNFHSRNQHFTIYCHIFNFMWMIFLWGKFTMNKITSLLLFCGTLTLRVESVFSKECRSQRSLEILLTMQGATSWAKVWSVALVLRWCILCLFLGENRFDQICLFLVKCSAFVGWFVLFLSCIWLCAFWVDLRYVFPRLTCCLLLSR